MKMFFNHGHTRTTLTNVRVGRARTPAAPFGRGTRPACPPHGRAALVVAIIALVSLSTLTTLAADPAITVSARQRYPWNGLVDVHFTITGDAGTKYDTSFTAKDKVGNTNITMRTLRKADGTVANVAKEQLLPGIYNWVWDAAADLPKDFKCDRISILVHSARAYPSNGLVAYWPFDGNLQDVSGNAYNMKSASVTYSSGVNGKTAYWKGSVSTTLSKSLSVSSSMTVACWVKPQKVGNKTGSINMGSGNFGLNFRDFAFIVQGKFGLSVEMQRVLVFKDDNCYLLKEINLSDGWHHVAVTVSGGGKPVLYVDGVAVTGATVVSFGGISLSSPTIGGKVRTGQNPEADQRYKGYLDDLLIYNRALSASEIKSVYSVATPPVSGTPRLDDITYSSSGLVAYWPFDKNGTDASSNGYNLTTAGISWPTGVGGYASYFSGTVNMSSSKAISVKNTMTIAFWAKPQKVGTRPTSLNMGYGNWGYNFDDYAFVVQGGLGISLETHRITVFKDDCCYLQWNGELGEQWHHYAITIANGGTPILFVDGVKKTNVTSTSFGSVTLLSPIIGGKTRTGQNPNSDQRYKGYLDELFIYNRVLSESEIKALCKTIE